MTEVHKAARTDTPRMAYSVLERRATVTIVGMLLVLAGAAWWWTVRTAHDMQSMVQGLASIGAPMSFDMGVLIFLVMWTTMMVAMMFPTIAPIVLLHRLVMRRQNRGSAPTTAFVLGYLVVWTAAGLVPLALLLAFRNVAHDAGWVTVAAGGVLIVAGAYQFTPWKQKCLRACRTPLSFLATHDFGNGLRGTFRTGAAHGLYCLGCCWALMSVLLVVGLMNLAWMAVLAAVFLAEKHSSRGVLLTRIVGTAVVALGIAIIVHPPVLESVAPTPGVTEPMPGM